MKLFTHTHTHTHTHTVTLSSEFCLSTSVNVMNYKTHVHFNL